jgi:hypothetical protein
MGKFVIEIHIDRDSLTLGTLIKQLYKEIGFTEFGWNAILDLKSKRVIFHYDKYYDLNERYDVIADLELLEKWGWEIEVIDLPIRKGSMENHEAIR